jgi:toxin FitB
VSVVVLDTDVASALFRRRLPEPLSRQVAGQVVAVTFVTVGKLTKWTVIRHWGPTSIARLRSLLDDLLILPYDTRVAARWGVLQAYAQLRGRPRPVNDTWIAACGLVRELLRATLNTKDYPDFSEHEGLELLLVHPSVGG